MNAGHWERVQTLFHEAADLPEPERHPFLKANCPDPEMVQEVLALLHEDARHHSVLDGELAHVASRLLDGYTPAPRSIGPYRICRMLGRGGMGVVFLAEREDLGSKAAIKILRDATLSPARRERFAYEQHLLAQLTHPSIARLIDADTLSDGTPYFVMEYVDGVPLTTYCTRHELTIPERLELFRSVCEAVQYAHRQAVVHRDLKPSNILVTQDGQVKLLDFGIAKRLEDTHPRVTQTGLRMVTPMYAAPEQLRDEPVGVYTDVYALGLILYELLTGRLPFDLSGLTAGQVEAVILQSEAVKPSLVVRKKEEYASAARRPLLPDRRAWADLDVLCLTAMHKDPQRRYSTVEVLIRDLDHYLKNEPLEARPDTLSYRTNKFLRRHRRPVSMATLVLSVVIGLVIFYTLQLASARDAALSEAARTQRIQHFLLNLFQGGDESFGPADSLRVITLIDRGVQEVRVLDGESEVQAELYQTIGGIYQKLGRLDQADSLLRSALEQRQAFFGEDHPEVARSQIALGLLRIDQAILDEADKLVQEGLEKSRLLLHPNHPAVADALTALGQVKSARGEYDQAVELLEEAVRLHMMRPPATVKLSETLTDLANTHFYAGHLAVSDSLNRLVLALNQRLYGKRHPSVANSLVNLGATQFQLGYYREAERYYRQALSSKLAYFGPNHPEMAATMIMLGQSLVYQERLDEALSLLQPALTIRERVYGPDHPRVASALNELGLVALQQGDLAAAEDYFSRMVIIYQTIYPQGHYLIGIANSNLASVYLESKDFGRAGTLFQEAVDCFTETLSADHLQTAIARIKLGRVLARQERYEAAKEQTLVGYEVLDRQANPSVSWLQAARRDLVTVFEALGDTSQAARFHAELEEHAAELL